MKAELKINYGKNKKGEVFNVDSFQKKRITLLIDSKKVDFGFSEVEITAKTKKELFDLGRDLIHIQTYGFCMRDADIKKAIETIDLPIKKTLSTKAINEFLFN